MLKDKQFLLDVLATSVGQVLVIACVFIQNKWLSILLESSGYLEYYLINQVGSVISFFILFGLGIAIPKYIASAHALNDEVLESSYFFSAMIILMITICIGGVLLICLSGCINNYVFEGRNESLLAFLLSAGICLSNFIYAYYRGIGNFILSNSIQICIGIVSLLYLLLVDSVLLVVIGIAVIQIIISAVFLVNLFVKYIKVKPSFLCIKKNLCEIYSYCWPRVPGEIFLFSYNLVPVALINNLYGNDVGINYVIALGIVAASSSLFKFIGLVLLPYASKMLTNSGMDHLFEKVDWLLKVSLAFAILAVVVINIFPKFSIFILYSSMYYNASDVVQIVSFCIIPHSVYLILRNPLDGLSKKPFNTISIFISLITLCSMIVASKYIKNIEIFLPLCFVVGNILLGTSCFFFWKIEKNKLTKINNKI